MSIMIGAAGFGAAPIVTTLRDTTITTTAPAKLARITDKATLKKFLVANGYNLADITLKSSGGRLSATIDLPCNGARGGLQTPINFDGSPSVWTYQPTQGDTPETTAAGVELCAKLTEFDALLHTVGVHGYLKGM